MDVSSVRAAIDSMGWSTLVVGDESLIKVHVHVHDPGQPISYAIGLGVSLDDIVVENMQEQYQKYVEERLTREEQAEYPAPLNDVAVITVASGEGLHRLFKQELQAAIVISGGQTMNPSTQEFLSAIETLPNDKIILLPNNKNIILAAQQAASLTQGKQVVVVPSRTMPQGISALLSYTNVADSGDLDDAVAAMTEALGYVTSCEVTTATRDVEIDGVAVREGQYIGLLDGALVDAGDDLTDVIKDLLHKADANAHEVVTLYHGVDVYDSHVQALLDVLTVEFPKPTFVSVRGDQPLYPYLISVE